MDVKKYFISVCIVARPKENLDKCVNSLKNQTYKNFEVVIHKEINKFSIIRNKVIDKSNGELIVFIDADCYAHKHWLNEMNLLFQDKDIICVWGKVCYELHGNMPTISTRIVDNDGNRTVTANAGFRADLLKKVRFDEEFYAAEDKIINERLKKFGKIVYSGNPLVFHTHQRWSFKGIINHAKKIEDDILANIKYNIPLDKFGIIVHPSHYLIIFFPFLIFITNSIRSFYDLKIAIGNYIEKVYTRILIWKSAIKNKKFYI